MNKFKDIFLYLRNSKDFNQEQMAHALGVSKSTIGMWETGKRLPSPDMFEQIADYFNVDIDYLYGRKTNMREVLYDEYGKEYVNSNLTNKDKKDIAKRLDDTLNELKNPDGLMFDGEVLDKETADLIRSSLKNVLTTGKVLAKNKYTPKKYRNDEE